MNCKFSGNGLVGMIISPSLYIDKRGVLWYCNSDKD